MKPVALIILDGLGYSPTHPGNAVQAARTPILEDLFARYPHTLIRCSGEDVGLPEGQMGNSEVGHLNIGAGRIVYQFLPLISKEVATGQILQNEALRKAMLHAKDQKKTLHLLGLVSDGGVHAHIEHLQGLLDMAKSLGLSKVLVHAFTDGRDCAPQSGAGFIKQLESYMARIGLGAIATLSGRYYAMDRDHRYERTEKAYRAIVLGQGHSVSEAFGALTESYSQGVTDEFLKPCVVQGSFAPMQPDDSVIFFNFRPDRARQLTRALVDPDFTGFDRSFFPVDFVTLTQYDAAMPNVSVAYSAKTPIHTLGQYLSLQGYTQLRIAETEKYPHVTFFFNGGIEPPYEGESRILIDSPKVATYDQKPQMSAYEVTQALLADLAQDPKDVIILNYANADMVGHTGVFEAAVKAVETVDECLGQVVNKILELGGACLISADHGNAEQMIDSLGEPFTQHTTNRVPLLYVSAKAGGQTLKEGGRLSDFAPTVLALLGLSKPPEMTGESLLIEK